MNEPTMNLDINERIRQEHERLRNLLGSIARGLLARQGTVEDVVQQFSLLRDELQAHFEEEEHQGFFDQITDQAPRFARQTTKLCDEHIQMLNEVTGLIGQAEVGDGSNGWWSAMESAFHDLSKELMQHEHEENELLQVAYSDDIGSKD